MHEESSGMEDYIMEILLSNPQDPLGLNNDDGRIITDDVWPRGGKGVKP